MIDTERLRRDWPALALFALNTREFYELLDAYDELQALKQAAGTQDRHLLNFPVELQDAPLPAP